jgi:hypothetical protein
MKSAAKLIYVVCAVGFFALFLFWISFYFRAFPSKPQPQLGRNYPIHYHQFVWYLTEREEFEHVLSLFLAAVLLVSAAIIGLFVDPFDRRKRVSLWKRVGPLEPSLAAIVKPFCGSGTSPGSPPSLAVDAKSPLRVLTSAEGRGDSR